MQKIIRSLLLGFSLLLTGCGNVKNENAIYSTSINNGKTVDIKVTTVEYLIKEKYSFPLLAYTEECSYCQKAKTNIETVARENHTLFYTVEMYESAKNYLCRTLPEIFGENDSYPTLYIFNNGNVSYKSSINDVTNLSNVRKLAKSYFIDTNITYSTDLSSYEKYEKLHDEYLCYVFDSSTEDTKDIYSEYLFPLAIKSKKNILLIDKNVADYYLFKRIQEIYNTDNDVLFIYQEGKIKVTLSLEEASDDDIKNLFFTFFDVDSIDSSL